MTLAIYWQIPNNDVKFNNVNIFFPKSTKYFAILQKSYCYSLSYHWNINFFDKSHKNNVFVRKKCVLGCLMDLNRPTFRSLSEKIDISVAAQDLVVVTITRLDQRWTRKAIGSSYRKNQGIVVMRSMELTSLTRLLSS